MSVTSNSNELLLYRVLEKANLACYYEAFISQGGDDVNQLCEAGEDEFLEIMALVGMASKPLHVRRLQKALHEWVTDPASIAETNGPRKPIGISEAADGSILAAFLLQSSAAASRPSSRDCGSRTLHGHHQSMGRRSYGVTTSNRSMTNGDVIFHGHLGSKSSLISNSMEYLNAEKPSSPLSDNNNSDQEMTALNLANSFSDQSTAVGFPCIRLHDSQLKEIERTADEISANLPFYAPKPLNMKKPIDKEIVEAMNIREEDPNRMELLRKYSAIYGRFDSKRRCDKQMNFHEMCVNEAAAQLCKHNPSLLTRREDLFILARQVVRQAGFQYSKGQYRSKEYLITSSPTDGVVLPPKKLKTESIQPSPPVACGDLTFSKHHQFLLSTSMNQVDAQDDPNSAIGTIYYGRSSAQCHDNSQLALLGLVQSDFNRPPNHNDLDLDLSMNAICSSTSSSDVRLYPPTERQRTSTVREKDVYSASFTQTELGRGPAISRDDNNGFGIAATEADEQREWLRETGMDIHYAIIAQETQKPAPTMLLTAARSLQTVQVAAAAEVALPTAAIRDIKAVTRELRSNKNSLLVRRDVMATVKPERT